MSRNHVDWKSSYNLGIEDIDFQHRCFANLINRLSDELLDTDSPDHMASLIDELNAYAHFHFKSEENMMRQAGYPDVDEHMSLHHELINQLGAKEGMLHIEKTRLKSEEIIEFLIDWFLNHTIHEDRLFADYLHKKET